MTKDHLRIPRDLLFTEAQVGTQHRFQPVMGTPRGATGNDRTEGSEYQKEDILT